MSDFKKILPLFDFFSRMNNGRGCVAGGTIEPECLFSIKVNNKELKSCSALVEDHIGWRNLILEERPDIRRELQYITFSDSYFSFQSDGDSLHCKSKKAPYVTFSLTKEPS